MTTTTPTPEQQTNQRTAETELLSNIVKLLHPTLPGIDSIANQFGQDIRTARERLSEAIEHQGINALIGDFEQLCITRGYSFNRTEALTCNTPTSLTNYLTMVFEQGPNPFAQKAELVAKQLCGATFAVMTPGLYFPQTMGMIMATEAWRNVGRGDQEIGRAVPGTLSTYVAIGHHIPIISAHQPQSAEEGIVVITKMNLIGQRGLTSSELTKTQIVPNLNLLPYKGEQVGQTGRVRIIFPKPSPTHRINVESIEATSEMLYSLTEYRASQSHPNYLTSFELK